MAKAPSLRKDRTKGTQRTRELSTGKAPWSWRNGKERFVHARRGTAGAKPYTMKVVRTVFNGGHEETYGNATRLVPTQRKADPDIPCLLCQPGTSKSFVYTTKVGPTQAIIVSLWKGS